MTGARPGPSPGPAAAAVRPVWRAAGSAIIALRYVIVAFWLAAAAAATILLPRLSASGGIGNLAPGNAPGVRAEQEATRLFGMPLTAEVDVVQRDPAGFPLPVQLHAVTAALKVDEGAVHGISGLIGALPVIAIGKGFAGARERGTTIVTLLFFKPSTAIPVQSAGGREYAHRFVSAPQDHLAGITGLIPARSEQGSLILRYLPWVELATVAAIAIIVGWHFRSPGAPLASLACSGVAYSVVIRVVAWAAQRSGVTVPPDLEPILVVLLLGISTDYSVFFLSGMRRQLAGGVPRLQAARLTTAQFVPIILTAGLIVSFATASLLVATQKPLQALGPGLAITVAIAMVVALTLMPALIAVFGGLLFWPGPAWLRHAGLSREGLPGGAPVPREERGALERLGDAWRRRSARAITRRPVALIVAAACVAALAAAALQVRDMELAFPVTGALPGNAEAVRAASAASKGFAPGILSPTEVLVIGRDVRAQQPALDRLQRALSRWPGTAGVIGPANVPAVLSAHLTMTPSGSAARYGVIESTPPLGARAISDVRNLQRHLPAMARKAGLSGVRLEVGGESIISAETIDTTTADSRRIGVVILAVIFVLLAVFLRALLAPLYLLAASLLAVLAALGLTTWIFQGILGFHDIVYYVPFAAGVLLVSLGSDYNVFVVGRIWQAARRRSLRGAVATAAPRASHAITTAGLALAASFAFLSLAPLAQFRELAAAMAIGIFLDTFIVRSLLIPALVVLFGRAGSWPGASSPRLAPWRG